MLRYIDPMKSDIDKVTKKPKCLRIAYSDQEIVINAKDIITFLEKRDENGNPLPYFIRRVEGKDIEIPREDLVEHMKKKKGANKGKIGQVIGGVAIWSIGLGLAFYEINKREVEKGEIRGYKNGRLAGLNEYSPEQKNLASYALRHGSSKAAKIMRAFQDEKDQDI